MPANQLIQTTAPVLLLEREAELAALEAMLGAAQSGDGRLVVVEGSAGIGKTRLLAEARALAAGGGVRGSDRARRRARRESLRSGSCGSCSRRRWPRRPRSSVPSCLPAPPELSASAVRLGAHERFRRGAESSFAMLHGLYWLAANFASRTPTLLVVDDLHWADEPSLRWLIYLARRLEGLPLLLLVGTRARLSRPTSQRSSRSFSPIPSAVADSARPLSARSRPRRSPASASEPSPTAAFAARAQTGSGGNPLYLVALLDAVSGGKGSRRPPSERTARARARPAGESRTASRRASRACRPKRPGCCVRRRSSAIAPSSLSPPRSPGSRRTTALTAASALVRADLLRHENPLEFTHPVVRTAVLENDERGRAHAGSPGGRRGDPRARAGCRSRRPPISC